MKYSLALIALVAAMASAAPAEDISVRSQGTCKIKQGTPFCAGRDHCVYMGKHAFTYLNDPKSRNANKDVICESYDENGHGRGACQFPNKVATTIQCDYTGDVAYVKFGCHHSEAKFHSRTKMTMIWSSQKRMGLAPQTTDIATTEVGDDLYVRCHAGRHHKHDDNKGTSSTTYTNDNYGKDSHGSGSASGTASGSGSGYASGSVNFDKGLPNVSGSVGGAAEGSINYNAGLPNIP